MSVSGAARITPCVTLLVLASSLLLAASLTGCESAQEKCDKARAEAHRTWTSYVVSLETAMEEARDTERRGNEQMPAIERRLSEPVKADADARYERASDAWMRAFQTGMHKACMQDEPCAELKEATTQAADLLEDFGQRLALAKAAQASTRGTVAQARSASIAVMLHADYPVVKAAQGSTDALVERCKELPPPKSPEDQP